MKKFGEFTAKEGVNLLNNGLLRVNPNNSDYCSAMLIEETESISDDGYLSTKTKVGFITGKVADMQKAITSLNPVDFKIIKVETISPEDNKGFRALVNPETNVAVTSQGAPIYWKTVVVPVASPLLDTLVVRDRADAEAQSEETFSADELEA